eukprot:XP_002260797.1 hypothetical protein, conserved in Plasmodium species [Plasmodium knowlesi strain H]
MFEEFFLNKKNERESREITADDLISLTSKKTNRCFYVPVVVYIGDATVGTTKNWGYSEPKEVTPSVACARSTFHLSPPTGKCNHIRSYEEGLIKEKEKKKKNEKIERDNLRRQIQRDKKNRERNERMNYVWEDELFGRSKCCNEAMSIDHEGKLTLESTNVKGRNSDSGEGGQIRGSNPEGVQNDELLNGEPRPRETNCQNTEEPHEQVDCPKEVEATEKKKGNQSIHNNDNRNNSEKMKKATPGRKGKSAPGRKSTGAQQEKKTSEIPLTEESKQLPPQEQKANRKIYYDSLMQRVINNIEKKKEKKKKHLTTFNFVTYYKLHELIYISFLVDKYQGYYQGKEESDLIEIYIEERKKIDRSKCNREDAPGETTIKSGEENVQGKIHSTVEDMKKITLEDVVQKYKGDREKEEKKKKKLKKKTHKYIHSKQLANYQFVGKNIKEIMNCVLYNLNIFFNDKLLDVERVMEEYSTVVRNICEDTQTSHGNVCTQVVIPIDADKTQKEILNGKNTLSEEIIQGNQKVSLIGESPPLNERGEATVIINSPTCDSLSRLKNKKKWVPNVEVATFDELSGTGGEVKKEITKGDDNPKCAEGVAGTGGDKDEKEGKAEGGNKNIIRGHKGWRKKRMHTFKRPSGTYHSENDEEVDAVADVQLDNEETASDYNISYENLKYSKEEIKQTNFIYHLTHDINKIETFRRKYFYDFFFMYMVRKLFWNVLCLYYLHWKERLAEDASMRSGSPVDASPYESMKSHPSSPGLDDDNLILYESDVSVNNTKKNKAMLYNTNQKLCYNLDPLFKLIRNEKLLIYLRYDQNKRVKCKNKTEYVYREIWQYLILTNLKKKSEDGAYGPFSEFVLFHQD